MNFFKYCNGEGMCLNACPCTCSNECKCEHKDHDGYCPNFCCELVHCRNYDYCGYKMPLWILKDCNGLCNTCYVQMGEHNMTNIIEECPICLEDSPIIKLSCNHELCNDCWYNITRESCLDEKKEFIPECPLCRGKN